MVRQMSKEAAERSRVAIVLGRAAVKRNKTMKEGSDPLRARKISQWLF